MNNQNYTKIDNHIEQISETEDIAGLYNEDFVNWSGPRNPSADQPYYSNYVAEKLLEKLNLHRLYSKIDGSERDDYFVKTHDGSIDKFTNRKEEIFAKSLFGHSVGHLGRVIDYQMPLKKKQTDDFGKVDLVSLNTDTNTAFLIELKLNLAGRDEETVLRAALEIETYYHALKNNRDRFSEYISKKIEALFGNDKPNGLNTKTVNIRKAVLFAIDKKAGLPQELKDENAGHYQYMRKLLAHLGTSVYVMDYTYPVQRIAMV